jgi:hypothetical protein
MAIAAAFKRFRDYVIGPPLRESRVHTGNCQICGNNRRIMYVTFYRNVGMLFMRRTYTVQGDMCLFCVRVSFWDFTRQNFVQGWWGPTSLWINPMYLVENLVSYLVARYQLRGSLD